MSKTKVFLERILTLNTDTLNTIPFLDQQLSPWPLNIEIVSKGQELYDEGRKLANYMYSKIWNTKCLIDDNDFGIVVTLSNQIVGNVNLQIKNDESCKLHSELFFSERHWQQYLNIADVKIAEISGLCVLDTIPQFMSRPVIMGLVYGLHLLHNSLQIRYLTTIQHEYLIRILQKSLNLPFFRNEIITCPQGQVPDDNYWKRDKLPGIYYIDGYSTECIKACASLFCYLNIAGYHTQISSGKYIDGISYSTFWKKWDSRKVLEV
jgi:hypothetical protein